MHEIVFNAAAVWTTVLVGVCVAAVAVYRSAATRIVFVELATLLMVAALIALSAAEGVPYFIDAALVLGLLAFVGTVAGARFLGRGRIFD